MFSMKGINLLVFNAKNEDKQNIPNNSTNSHNQQDNSLNIKLKQFQPIFHIFLSIYILITSSASYHHYTRPPAPNYPITDTINREWVGKLDIIPDDVL